MTGRFILICAWMVSCSSGVPEVPVNPSFGGPQSSSDSPVIDKPSSSDSGSRDDSGQGGTTVSNPTYSMHVAKVVNRGCADGCHTKEGPAGDFAFDSSASLKEDFDKFARSLTESKRKDEECTPPGRGVLTQEEIDMILLWAKHNFPE